MIYITYAYICLSFKILFISFSENNSLEGQDVQLEDIFSES